MMLDLWKKTIEMMSFSVATLEGRRRLQPMEFSIRIACLVTLIVILMCTGGLTLLAQFGLEHADAVRLTAANDYFVDIPTGDFQAYDVILAMQADGKPLSRRDRGPLWLMYPISDHAELNDPVYFRRLIWQVVRIESP